MKASTDVSKSSVLAPRLSHGPLGVPAVFKEALVHSASRYTNTVCPIGNCLGFTVPSNLWAGAPVSVLRRCCCPSTVLRSVIAVAVDAVEAVAATRSRPKAFIERLKIFPLFHISDSASAIQRVRIIKRIVASHAHGIPRGILWLSRHPMPSVLPLGSSSFSLQAATASLHAVRELPGPGNGDFATIAPTPPGAIAMRIGNKLGNNQSSVSVTGKVDFIGFSHR